MSDAYHQLLEAAIQHVEELKRRGVRFVAVSRSSLENLQAPRASAPRTRSSPPGTVPAVTAPRSASSPSVAAPSRAGEQGSTAVVSSAPATPAAVSPASSPAKVAAFAELRQRVLACTKCAHLVAARKSVVFGVGNIDAELMFIGEAPGADEDEQGEPFVGKAGQLLTRIIQAMGLQRESVYIANILKCRPDTPDQSSGNRKPTPDEMQTCIPYLHEQIDLIRPKVIVALGGTAVEGLLGKSIGITRLRGQWRTYREIPLMPTFHPSYLLRPEHEREKRRVWEDMLQVMERLGLPISERQRNFFLKG